MIKLKENALLLVIKAMSKRVVELKVLINNNNTTGFIELVQSSLISYEDLVEPSRLNLEDEFWSCLSVSEKEQHSQDIKNILQLIQANKMAAAMDEVASLKDCYISGTSARQIFSLIEEILNNKEEYGV